MASSNYGYMDKRYETKTEEIKLEKPKFEFSDLADAEQYLDWKKTVPQEVRRLVEAAILEREISPSQTGLPLSDQFLSALSESLRQKKFIGQAGSDVKISNLLKPLERVKTKAGYLNVFETLTNASASWNLKKKVYETQVKIALKWLAEQDLNKLAEKVTEQVREERQQEDKEQKSPPDNVPPQNEDI